nr:NAD(P)-dependent oxidoreductase [Sulfodiicoccus acidiphilus]
MKVGLVGLGVMGWPIAANLASAGKLSYVANRTQSKAREFATTFKVEALEMRELAAESDVVITMLSDDSAVRDFVRSVLAYLKGKILVDMSTISPSLSIQLAEEVRGAGGVMYDAPVVGTSIFAQQRKLVVLLGGPEEKRELVEDLLKHTASAVVYFGGNGSGLYSKLVNNLMVGTYVAALAEAFNLGVKAGLSKEQVERILTQLSSVRSPTSELKAPKLRTEDYSTQFATKHMRKDLEIVQGEAQRLGLFVPMSSLALQLYRLAEASGMAERDFSSIYEIYKKSK